MADGVNATMDDVQTAAPDPPLDHLRRHPKLPELPPGDHPVLTAGQRRHLRVRLGPCEGPNVTLVFHAADAGEEMRTRGAQFVPS